MLNERSKSDFVQLLKLLCDKTGIATRFIYGASGNDCCTIDEGPAANSW